MDGILIAFTVSAGKNKTESSIFAKKFYGQDSTSHKGKYKYHRHGLLDEIPYRKLIRGVVIVKTEDARRVEGFLRKHSANFHARIIKLIKEDCKMLGMNVK